MVPVIKSCNDSRIITQPRFVGSTWPGIRTYIDNLFSSMYPDKKTVQRILGSFDGEAGRVRPYIVSSLGRIFSIAEELVVPFAALVEIVHTASLVHDDIQDRTEKRRGALSLWRRYSIDEAVILGDCMVVGAYRVLESLDISDPEKIRLFSLINAKVVKLVSGQLYDGFEMKLAGLDDYERIAAGKTGSLFGLAVAGTFLLSGNEPVQDRYGRDFNDLETCLGTIYQMRDDIADLLGRKTGRPPGDDILKGHVTVFSFLENQYLDSTERSLCNRLTERFRNKKDRASYDRLVLFFKEKKFFARLEKLFVNYRNRLLATGFASDYPDVGYFLANLLDRLDVKHGTGGPD